MEGLDRHDGGLLSLLGKHQGLVESIAQAVEVKKNLDKVSSLYAAWSFNKPQHLELRRGQSLSGQIKAAEVARNNFEAPV